MTRTMICSCDGHGAQERLHGSFLPECVLCCVQIQGEKCSKDAPQESKKASCEKATAMVPELKAMKMPETAKKIEAGIEKTLTCCYFLSENRVKIRTNSVIEQLNRKIRCRMRVVGAFPDGTPAQMLVCARLRQVAGTQWSCKKYMNMKHLEVRKRDQAVADSSQK